MRNPSTYSASIDVKVQSCCRGAVWTPGCQPLDASPLDRSLNNQLVRMNETETVGAVLVRTNDVLKADFRVFWNSTRLGYDALNIDDVNAQIGRCMFMCVLYHFHAVCSNCVSTLIGRLQLH